MELLLELLQESPDKRPDLTPPRTWLLMVFLDWDIAMQLCQNRVFFTLASEL
jgi:hypothetical protein